MSVETIEQNHSVAWGVIVVMLLLLAALWIGLYVMAAPIAGL